ncbi:coagulation factor XIII B chain-like isoform X2 [Cololabis saira]|uniref:coagulation factor XIII B chain-like isoform X2 n=1 Tax=Cololabis saira TaxID=129043 RepID=UPI002AD4368A|nr:coagulation factor XIII B chain-like isoform X2 [Cololabis saira]
MLVRFLGFVLLAVLPGALHAQEDLSCAPPVLNGGYFSPKLNKYSKETLTYSCDTGKKPVVEGWWATATCQDGIWSPEPQCIDERSCIPPIIPNRKYVETQNGWYEERHIITVQCDNGYELQSQGKGSNIKCNNGKWSHLPVCEKRQNACDMPPKIRNAVIVGQEPQEVFAASSELKYECEEGYDTGTAATRRRVVCQDGTWTQGPACRQVRPCGMKPADYDKDIYLSSTTYIEEGESKTFPCRLRGYTFSARCINRRLETTGCCYNDYIQYEGNCVFSRV